MGFVAFCLIAKWPPAVAACRAYRGTDFYWDAPELPDGEPDLPFAVESPYVRGYDFMEAGYYYTLLRRRLPENLRAPADAFLGTVYDDLGDGCPVPVDDLTADAGVAEPESRPYYSMRPDTVRQVLRRAEAVPWPEIQPIGEAVTREPITRHDVCDFAHFRIVVGTHEDWLRQAASAGRGLIVLLSQ